jgi:hypothetical protein
MVAKTERQRTGPTPRRGATLAAVGGAMLALALGLAACASGQSTASNQLALAQVPWCDQPSINFQDDSKLTPATLTDWTSIKGQLGFTPYLPATLPKGTCLALAGGSVHDPIFGGRFLITYYLPGTGPLSFSEAPKNASTGGHLASGLQCSESTASATATPAGATPTASTTPAPTSTPTAPLTICLGTVSDTNISIASAMSPAALQTLYKELQPNVEWVPPTPKTTPTATAKS